MILLILDDDDNVIGEIEDIQDYNLNKPVTKMCIANMIQAIVVTNKVQNEQQLDQNTRI